MKKLPKKKMLLIVFCMCWKAHFCNFYVLYNWMNEDKNLINFLLSSLCDSKLFKRLFMLIVIWGKNYYIFFLVWILWRNGAVVETIFRGLWNYYINFIFFWMGKSEMEIFEWTGTLLFRLNEKNKKYFAKLTIFFRVFDFSHLIKMEFTAISTVYLVFKI